jgi:hypothetical protein
LISLYLEANVLNRIPLGIRVFETDVFEFNRADICQLRGIFRISSRGRLFQKIHQSFGIGLLLIGSGQEPTEP